MQQESVDLAGIYLHDVVVQFRKLKELAERALARVADENLAVRLDPAGDESNSVAVLVQHMAGNLRSRWTDFLTTDGEKPERDRDGKFELAGGVDRAALMARWTDGWERLFAALSGLTAADLLRTVHIRGEAHSVPQAIHRQMTHQAYHVGQLVLLAKHFAGGSWESLSVPKGKTRELNAAMRSRAEP
jgi:hypothetical protein